MKFETNRIIIMLYLQPSVPAIAKKSMLATRLQKKVNQKLVDKEVIVKKKGGKDGGRVSINQNISNGSNKHCGDINPNK